MDELEIIQSIRSLEQELLRDTKKINNILSILQYLSDESLPENVRAAAIHSLRRVFIHIIEKEVAKDKGENAMSDKQLALAKWTKQQLLVYMRSLQSMIIKMSDSIQEPAIKTMIEFIPKVSLLDGRPMFSKQILALIIEGLMHNQNGLSAEILLMTREELFSKLDCVFHGLSIIENVIQDRKGNAVNDHFAENALDVLRIISLPDDITDMELLVPLASNKNDNGDSDDSDSDAEDDNSDDDMPKEKSSSKPGSKRAASKPLPNPSNKKKTKTNSNAKLMSLDEHKKRFSKAWIALLSLQFTPSQHKIILKHLSDHVIMHLTKPLLIADYLSRSYEAGGIVSVLALESLFHLILHHNLDYPNFFNSLYKLCKREVFEAKYRSKFMKLLSKSLQSSNLPAYIVAAFIKRLVRLCLVVPSPAGYYCIAQVIWLLRKHPQCQVLIHRVKPANADAAANDVYDAFTDDFEKSQALQSSLWEVIMIQQHHVRGIAILAKAVEATASTSSGVDSMYLNVNDMIDRSYSAMIDEELKAIKNHSELAYQTPAALFPSTSHVSSIFG